MIELSIIIVNWNTRELLLRCLASIDASPPARSWEVWVVDNASTDGSREGALERYPPRPEGEAGAFHVIGNAENVGFARANNQALARCTGRHVLLLNSDTEVLPGALEGMCAYLDSDPRIGALGCRLLNPDGTTQRSGWRGYPGLQSALIDGLYLWRLLPRLVARQEVTLGTTNAPTEVDHLLGACIMVPREVLEVVGFLDDNYFLFLEETDWCRRIKRAGYRVVYLPHQRIIHFGQQSMRQIPARTLPTFYASLCHFVRNGGGRALGLRLMALKLIIAISVLIRMAIWTLRLGGQRALSLRMIGGYGVVLRRLPTL